MNHHKKIQKIINSHSGNPVLVHSDLFAARSFLKEPIHLSRESFLLEHLNILKSIIDEKNIQIPCFNYNFPKTLVYNAQKAESQIGPFPEYLRLNWANSQSLDPVFSFLSLSPIKILEPIQNKMTAFSEQSAFHSLVSENGSILFYGAPISSTTFIHYAEFKSGNPLYRYDKKFVGKLILENHEIEPFEYTYPVRPFDKYLDYDWSKIETDLVTENILNPIYANNQMIMGYLDVKFLLEFWQTQIQKDPFYLLDQKSKDWVIPMVEKLGRRFELEDFELN